MRIDFDEPRAAELFWEGMRDVAAGAARHQDDDLYRAIVKIGRGALAQGGRLRLSVVELEPARFGVSDQPPHAFPVGGDRVHQGPEFL